MIRFQRIGRTNDPAFRIVAIEKERAAKAGSIVELLGTYNPRSKALTLNEESVKGWIAKGAQPTGSIRNLLINKGVIEGKKVNVLPKKTPQKSEEAIAAEAAAANPTPVAEAAPEAESAVTEEAPAMPTEAEVVAEAEPAVESEPVIDEAPAVEVAEETPVVEVTSAETPAA